jgi:DNA-binding transcriptional MerR regulator
LDLIKERLYYTIGEVSELLNLSPSAIRYWEKQFSELKPSKRTGTSKRKYIIGDIEMLFKIKTILKDEGLSIKKAKEIIGGYKTGMPFETLKKLIDDSNRPEINFSGEQAESAKKIIDQIRLALRSLK